MVLATDSKIFDPLEVDKDYFLLHWEEQEDFYDKVNALPETITDILFDESTPEVIKKVSENHRLKDEQIANLSRTVRKILTADVYLGDIVKEVQGRLNLDQGSAKEIASQLISQLFAPALEDIKKLHIEKFGPPSRPPASRTSEGQSKATGGETNKENVSNPNNTVDLKNK